MVESGILRKTLLLSPKSDLDGTDWVASGHLVFSCSGQRKVEGLVFQGASQINLDVKGRLAVPVKHRDGLAAPSSGKLILTAHPHKCLLLYPEAAWLPIRDRVMTFPAMNATAAVWKRMLIGFAEELNLDNAGRILVSPELRAFAGIEKQIMFVGQGSHFEVWSLNAWNEQLSALTSGVAGLPPGTEDFSL